MGGNLIKGPNVRSDSYWRKVKEHTLNIFLSVRQQGRKTGFRVGGLRENAVWLSDGEKLGCFGGDISTVNTVSRVK